MTHRVLPSHTRVVDAAEKETYWSTLCTLWNVRSQSCFPGAHPKPVTRENCDAITAANHLVGLKTDGVRYVLLLTTRRDGVPIALMIDRSCCMFEVCIWGHSDYFVKGTVLDGELAWHNTSTSDASDSRVRTHALVYSVFDVVAVCGVNVRGDPFLRRLQTIHDVIFEPWRLMEDDELEMHVFESHKVVSRQTTPFAVTLRCKTWTSVEEARRLWDVKRHEQSLDVDGLIYMKCDAPMSVGATDDILKWKPHHTIDVRIDGDLQAWVDGAHASREGSAAASVALLDVAVAAGARSVVVVSTPTRHTRHCVVECETRWVGGTLEVVPLRTRFDKTRTNAPRTIVSAILAEGVPPPDGT